ncbi:MAG: cation:proton antiporter [Gammaproteobacteria bacterium]|nr:cation:proton antiporter [Gammaproteobacteria bacterium]
MEHVVLNDILILLSVAIVTVALFRRLGLPAILGYLCVGLVAGPHGLGWLVFDEVILFLGELGIVFLLFSIGLEFSLPLLLSMRRYLLGIGGIQVAGGTLAGFLIAQSFGVDWRGALVLGAATALSSTAIVLTQLAEQNELQERHGRISVGILLFQDLAAVPFLVIIPLLAERSASLTLPLTLALLKGAVAFVLIWFAGRRLLPSLLHGITRAGSRELFTLTVLFLALATAWLTGLFGLSLAMGAFLAGMLLSETVYRHQIEADARPFRDLLLGLFFVTVGMQLDYRLLPGMWLETLVLLLGITFGKGLLIVALVWAARQGKAAALRAGLLLGHGGEFGIALLALALGRDVLSHEAAQPVLAAMVISMLIAPVLARHNRTLVARLVGADGIGSSPNALGSEAAPTDLQEHVVIAGFGRLGQNLAVILRKLDVPYLALDLDPSVIRQARLAGEQVFYGDCTQVDLLARARLARARAMVITFDEPGVVERALAAARSVQPSVDVLVRTRDDSHYEALLGRGAREVIPETLEASLALADHLLRRLDYAEADIQPLLDSIRREGYRDLRSTFAAGEETRRASQHPGLQTVCVHEHSGAVGSRLAELQLDLLGVRVVAIRRRGIRGDEPLADTCLRAQDAVVLEGTIEQLDRARQRLLHGKR